MLRSAEERRALSGIHISRESPSISHILFADDTMIFCRATLEEAKVVMNILREYEAVSGQMINIKCSISSSPRTGGRMRGDILVVLGMKEVRDQDKYLGLPSHIGRTKKEIFPYIVGRVEERPRGWKGKLLSQAGKEILIKSVLSAIPNYVMNCFKLPLGIIDNLNSSMEIGQIRTAKRVFI
ncbi:hypothetical protein LIER_39678 [Lithospermum erythrorhizon]|uniref:Reverse transcriptase domain-containing protein n=1 Tax=Lithospermum erythrorhizon TaxID=34254 RepID=A0AAV3QK32_LITER